MRPSVNVAQWLPLIPSGDRHDQRSPDNFGSAMGQANPYRSSALFWATPQRNHKEWLDGDEYDWRGPAPSKP
jgi:hypothetical protein